MANSTLITDYLGKGLASARPATPPIAAGALAVWYSTDTHEFDVWNGSAWVANGLSAAGLAALDLSTLPTADPGGGKLWINGGGGASGAIWIGPP